MPKFKCGDLANGQEMSAIIIEADNELLALRKMLSMADVYCYKVTEEEAVTINA